MARPEQLFDAHNLESVLLAAVEPRRPQRIVILLDGPIRAVTEEVRVRAQPERGVQIRAGLREGSRALGLAFLAEGGRVETGIDPSPQRQPGAWTPLSAILSQARVWANSIQDLLRPLGGLSARPNSDGPRINALGLPEMAIRVAELADGRRSVAQVFQAAGVDELLVARILSRLHAEGALVLTGQDDDKDEDDPLLPAPRPPASHFDMPERGWGNTSALPETDLNEFEGQAVRTDIGHWLQTEAPPESWQSEAAFKDAYSGDLEVQDEGAAPTERPAVVGPSAEAAPPPASLAAVPSETPAQVVDSPVPRRSHLRVATPPPQDSPTREAVGRVRQSVPFTTGRPEPSHEQDEFEHDEEVMLGPTRGLQAVRLTHMLWVLSAAAVVGLVLFLWGPGGDGERPDATLIAPVATASVATTTVNTATIAVRPDGPAADGLRPTVAAPDAPEVVRRAESLIEAERFREAGRLLKRLRSTRPKDPAVLILSGMVFVDTNRLRAAHNMADQALALDRRSFRAWVLKGSVLQFQGKKKRAMAAYARALKLGPDHPMSDQVRAVMGALAP